jgi:hypothetical protein
MLSAVAQFVSLIIPNRGRDSSVGTATGYGLDEGGVEVRVPIGGKIFPFPSRSVRFWGPPNLLSNVYWGFFLLR